MLDLKSKDDILGKLLEYLDGIDAEGAKKRRAPKVEVVVEKEEISEEPGEPVGASLVEEKGDIDEDEKARIRKLFGRK